MCGRSICISGPSTTLVTIAPMLHSTDLECPLSHLAPPSQISAFFLTFSLWVASPFPLETEAHIAQAGSNWCYNVQDDLEPKGILSLPPECLNHRCLPSRLVSAAMGITTQGFVHARYTFCSRSHLSWPVFPVHIWTIWNVCLVYISLHLKIGWFHNTCLSVFVLLHITQYFPGSTYWYMVRLSPSRQKNILLSVTYCHMNAYVCMYNHSSFGRCLGCYYHFAIVDYARWVRVRMVPDKPSSVISSPIRDIGDSECGPS